MATEAAPAGKGQETDPKPANTPPVTGAPASEGPDKGKPTDAEAVLLKENMAMKKKLKALDDANAAAEEKRLKDAGEYKALAEKAEAKAKTAQEKLKIVLVCSMARDAGLIDPDLVRLIDLSGVSFDDAGTVTGAEEAIAAFKALKPGFFAAPVPGERPTLTPKPLGNQSRAIGPGTFEEWEAMPMADRNAWAEKHSEAFDAICTASKNAVRRIF